jgi:aminoglycoside N3'-acetyltransferase
MINDSGCTSRETTVNVTIGDIRAVVRNLGVAGLPLCVHSSLRSFGRVEGGVATVVDGLLGEGCTLMVPTFTEGRGAVPPPPGRHLKRSAGGDASFDDESTRFFETTSEYVDSKMGAIPAEVLRRPTRVRGNHPRDSFSAVGSLASELIDAQRPLRVFAPLQALADLSGVVILLGVGLNRVTLLHYAEQLAGRRLFRRWSRSPNGQTVESEEGGCSSGFENLRPILASVERTLTVGQSRWRVFPAGPTLDLAAAAIRDDPRSPIARIRTASPARTQSRVGRNNLNPATPTKRGYRCGRRPGNPCVGTS